MSSSSEPNDIVTDILDAAFDKSWYMYSPEEQASVGRNAGRGQKADPR